MCVCVCVCECVCSVLVPLVGTLMLDSVGPATNKLRCWQAYCCNC